MLIFRGKGLDENILTMPGRLVQRPLCGCKQRLIHAPIVVSLHLKSRCCCSKQMQGHSVALMISLSEIPRTCGARGNLRISVESTYMLNAGCPAELSPLWWLERAISSKLASP